MARRLGPGAPLDGWREAGGSPAAPTTELEIDVDASPTTRSRLGKVASLLAGRDGGLSFAELRTLTGLATDDVRYILEIGLRHGVLRRTGAGNSLRYVRTAADGRG